MIKNGLGKLLGLMVLVLSTTLVQAKEVTIKGRIMSPNSTGVDVLIKTPIDGITFKIGNPSGYAFLEDGRIAQKHWAFAQTNFNGDESGEFMSFIIMVFENGDSLTLASTGGWNEDGMSGEYIRVLNGTGAYENAQVTGSYVGVTSPWEETFMVDFVMTITTP